MSRVYRIRKTTVTGIFVLVIALLILIHILYFEDVTNNAEFYSVFISNLKNKVESFNSTQVMKNVSVNDIIFPRGTEAITFSNSAYLFQYTQPVQTADATGLRLCHDVNKLDRYHNGTSNLEEKFEYRPWLFEPPNLCEKGNIPLAMVGIIGHWAHYRRRRMVFFVIYLINLSKIFLCKFV